MFNRQSVRNLSTDDLLQKIKDTLSQANSALEAQGWQAEHQALYDISDLINEADRRGAWQLPTPPAEPQEGE